MAQNYLYGLTVQGIQSYIFATNKLKEIIGASEIIEQLCTTWFFDFLTEDEKKNGTFHLNAAGNIRFETDKDTAKRIFKDFHFELLEKAPGVPFSQAVVKINNGEEYKAIQKLDKKLRGQRNVPLYGTDLGVMARQKYRPTGNFAVQENINVKDDIKKIDVITSAKYDYCDEKLLTDKVKIKGYNNLVYPSEFKKIAQDSKHSWLAVIHIDGNGMGIIIKKILEESNKKFETLKIFSDAVGTSTLKAFEKAIKDIVIPRGKSIEENGAQFKELPIRPLIIGGDDVTLIIRADLALEFTQVYLKAFEEETKKAGIKNGEGSEGLTACAGIAYVKEKFPFHYSANLAEELCTYAKNKSNREYSCVQFHKVQDSIIDNYDEIVERELKVNDEFTFQNGPYYLGEIEELKINKKKVKVSTIKKLTQNVQLLKQDDAPSNGIREWIDAQFNNPTMATTLMARLNDKSRGYKGILKKETAFMDYHTLLAINTKTN